MLSVLPRREIGAPVPGMVVKLRTSYHRGAKRGGRVDRFDQLTVPADIAAQLPEGAKFRVTFEGDRIVYERLG